MIDIIDEFEEEAYDPGMMFAYWFENLMAITGWKHLNFETQEISRRYWDQYHERKRKSYKEVIPCTMTET